MRTTVLVSAGIALVVALITAVAVQHFLPPSPVQVERPGTTLDRAEVGEIVREYMLQNPGLLEEMVAALEDEQFAAGAEAQRQAIIDNRDTIFESPHGFVAGNPDGDITLVEFFDYNCPYCRQMTPVVMELVESDPELRVVFRDWPVLGEQSVEASRVALALKNAAPESFLAFHTEMMSQRGRVDGERALDVADELGVDRDAIEAAMDAPEVDAALQETQQLGNRLALRGTPSYVLGDEVLGGAVGGDNLRDRIAELRRTGCAVC